MNKGLLKTLGISLTVDEIGKCAVEMPITEKVLQPFGYVHGGVNVVLAETAASLGAFKMIAEDEIAFGMEINANHLKAKREGILTATALLKHGGSTSQVWEIEVTDEQDELIALSRCTVAIRKKR
ncbi:MULTISPECIES: PaaI family thioesterase [Jeotgalicoccus]|jgi:uncharacterized domain 1|uniref:Hotdog fold thioesterase n=1 Tax=Jeotgalicoccus nanhaiensis TaxID=568603 RepID=A0ABR9XV91_9STAP|nr:hotdog fold thioesterase [Jeotgalicoccus nanhaiensis]MBF0752924.1 hotdog fold thioesterase [Jeotgalicoccus nanhaiensis]TFU63081.1 hotdog fold thioesterase [Jeotgalicoccus nanhaiensis]